MPAHYSGVPVDFCPKGFVWQTFKTSCPLRPSVRSFVHNFGEICALIHLPETYFLGPYTRAKWKSVHFGPKSFEFSPIQCVPSFYFKTSTFSKKFPSGIWRSECQLKRSVQCKNFFFVLKTWCSIYVRFTSPIRYFWTFSTRKSLRATLPRV